MHWKIGEVAARTACTAETIRFYEQRGLLPPPMRSGANYRLYGIAHVERLTFIRRCRGLGMSLDEILSLLAFQDQPGEPCRGVNALLDRHLAETIRQIAELQALALELGRLRSSCRHEMSVGECAILRDLGGIAPAATPDPSVY